jgi:hypothetical protein
MNKPQKSGRISNQIKLEQTETRKSVFYSKGGLTNKSVKGMIDVSQ